MKKTTMSLMLLLSVVSIQPMSSRLLIEAPGQTPQRRMNQKDIYTFAVAPAMVVGAISMAAQCELAIDIKKAVSKIEDNFTEYEKALFSADDFMLLGAARNALVSSSFKSACANFVRKAGDPDMVWAGLSLYLALQSAEKSAQGLKASQCLHEKIDTLIRDKKETN